MAARGEIAELPKALEFQGISSYAHIKGGK
jgi:hypothetical protein